MDATIPDTRHDFQCIPICSLDCYTPPSAQKRHMASRDGPDTYCIHQQAVSFEHGRHSTGRLDRRACRAAGTERRGQGSDRPAASCAQALDATARAGR